MCDVQQYNAEPYILHLFRRVFLSTMLRAIFIVLWTQTTLTFASPAQERLNKPLPTGHGRFFDIQVSRWVCAVRIMYKLIMLNVGGRLIEVGEETRLRVHFQALHGTLVCVNFCGAPGLMWSVHKGV